MPDAGGRPQALGLWSALAAEFERYKRAIGFIPMDQLRLQEDLRGYLCVRCAGFLEQVTYVILDDYLRRKSKPPIQDFARSHFNRVPNLDPKNFARLIARFGNDHEAALNAFLDEGDRRETLGDLLGVRHDIAHGRQQRGRKLDPTRYIALCNDIYEFLVARYIGDAGDVLAEDGKTVIGSINTPQ